MRLKNIIFCAGLIAVAGLAFLAPWKSDIHEKHAPIAGKGDKGPEKRVESATFPVTSVVTDLSTEKSHPAETQSEGHVFAVFGIPVGNSDHVDEYLDFEARADFDGDAALSAFRVLDGCNQIPPADATTSDIEAATGVAEAREACQEILDSANLARHELIDRAADLNQPEAILLRPSFPPPFSSYGRGQAGEMFAKWQDRTVDQLEELSNVGNIDAKLRLAKISAGEFPAYTDQGLAYLYVEEVLRSSNLTPFQEAAAASLRARLPKPAVDERRP
ncbi:hypothetical protein HFP89_04125 [Wenzhouxiangella sp. XN79A]|uniref:hypothetical protein n=1 Tax=Wenzhouxiangella sp. XN79A TaxID=2724193 RepID=UPI00144A83FD|nr:hypothetical protein [Wenzhouxiangella sp. XN79A]NKI34346.1 hypothetical protein [Wenzhouxiangella sp. XN79A]